MTMLRCGCTGAAHEKQMEVHTEKRRDARWRSGRALQVVSGRNGLHIDSVSYVPPASGFATVVDLSYCATSIRLYDSNNQRNPRLVTLK